MATSNERGSPVKLHGARVVCEIPAGASVALFGEWVVVVHPDAPPYMIHCGTGERKDVADIAALPLVSA